MGDMCLAQYGGIRPLPDGTKPLERVWPLVKNDIEVRLMLQPKKTLGSGGGGAAAKASRPGASADNKKVGPPGPNTDKNRSARKKKQERLKTQKTELAALKKSQTHNRDSKPPKTEPPTKVAKGDKGGGKGGGKGPSLPAALVGGNALTTDGKRKCYGFNTGERQSPECKATPAGGSCPNGLHVCTHNKCKDLSHSFLRCRNK